MFKKFWILLDSVSEWLGFILIFSMVSVIFFQVVWRYFLSDALSWPEETARYLFIWSTYIAISISMKNDGHLRVTVLQDLFLGEKMRGINVLCQGVNIVFFVMLIYLSYSMSCEIKEMEQMSIALPVPVWIVWSGIVVGCTLTLLQCLRNMYLILTDDLHAAKPQL